MNSFLKLCVSASTALLFLILSGTTSFAADKLRFGTVDIYINPQGQPLAAYQLELQANTGDVKISGIEGGDHAAFQNPPHYDPKAMQTNRVVLAAFHKVPASQLPSAKVRVATVHYLITGNIKPEFTLKLITSGTINARKIKAEATMQERENR